MESLAQNLWCMTLTTSEKGEHLVHYCLIKLQRKNHPQPFNWLQNLIFSCQLQILWRLPHALLELLQSYTDHTGGTQEVIEEVVSTLLLTTGPAMSSEMSASLGLKTVSGILLLLVTEQKEFNFSFNFIQMTVSFCSFLRSGLSKHYLLCVRG